MKRIYTPAANEVSLEVGEVCGVSVAVIKFVKDNSISEAIALRFWGAPHVNVDDFHDVLVKIDQRIADGQNGGG